MTTRTRRRLTFCFVLALLTLPAGLTRYMTQPVGVPYDELTVVVNVTYSPSSDGFELATVDVVAGIVKIESE